MSSDESRALLESLLNRGSDRIESAREAFGRKYPDATEQMVSAAVFHGQKRTEKRGQRNGDRSSLLFLRSTRLSQSRFQAKLPRSF